MRRISNSAKLIMYSPQHAMEHLEVCGRICYKSEDRITKGSASTFISNLLKRGHYAALEHANFVFEVNKSIYDYVRSLTDVGGQIFYRGDSLDEAESWGSKHLSFTSLYHGSNRRYLISGNVRAFNNCRCFEILSMLYSIHPQLVYNKPEVIDTYGVRYVPDLLALPDLKKEEIYAHCYLTFLCETDRGVSHEMVRHREASYLQESTRYCNYTKDKFGGELTFSNPSGLSEWSDAQLELLDEAFTKCEEFYNRGISLGLAPQQARVFLMHGIKTSIAMTTNVEEYLHFFALRYKGVTGAPHPDMRDLASKMYEQYRMYFSFVSQVHGVDFLDSKYCLSVL